ncbi:hypothetical protein KRR38_34135 [Novosphingobium sp. G106]|uniref:hypothetical protein n=1 Tax=Novosphingobium sp. G106 TaxID=2849500 RepID=UPI001C2DBB62|nr:hypothetical protein [Novosphingobium sp. G106]MBV1692539.1 hypothetical protein [Novosphingobium sp. G106]
MTIRTTTATVEFVGSFKLEGHDEILPAGIYHVDVDEEAIEAIHRTVYRRLETRLRIQTDGKTVHRRIEPAALEAALQRDRVAALETNRSQPGPSIEVTDVDMRAKRNGAQALSSPVRRVRCWIQATIYGNRRPSP